MWVWVCVCGCVCVCTICWGMCEHLQRMARVCVHVCIRMKRNTDNTHWVNWSILVKANQNIAHNNLTKKMPDRIGEPCTGIKFANGIWEHVNNRFVGVNLVLPFGGRNRNSKLKLIENLTFSDGTTYRLRLVMFGEVYRFLYFWTCSDACDVRQSSLFVTRGILP